MFFNWKKGENLKLSNHFNSLEFTCSCKNSDCVEQKISKELIEKLEKIRSKLGNSIIITSGYRCLKHQQELLNNPKIETVKNSQHVLGLACDVTTNNLSMLLTLLEQEFKAIGLAKTFYHVDLRDDKIRRWTY